MGLSDRIARLHIQMDDIQPAIWRRVEVPLTTNLRGLHEVIQAVMLFENYHLYEFEIAGRCYGIPDPEFDHWRRVYAAQNIKLGTLIDRGVTQMSYTYDFGDNWRHTIRLEAVEAENLAAEYPRFIDGVRRAPPEDVGGTTGFEDFLKAMTRSKHPDRANLMTWYGGVFVPDDIDETTISQNLMKLARRRALGKASYAKSVKRAQ